MTTHETWTDQLSLYLDDELPPEARSRLQTHLAECLECRRVRDDLARIRAWAPTFVGFEPETDRWPAVISEIERGRVLTLPRRVRRFTWRQMVAAGLVMAAAGGGAAWFLVRGTPRPSDQIAVRRPSEAPISVRPVSFADKEYDSAIAELEHTVAEGRSKLDTTTVRVVEESLRAIDRAIGEARAAIQRDPANAYLNGHVAANMRRKLELLRRTVRAIDAQT